MSKEIYIKNGKSAIVDDEDYSKLVKISWNLNKGYAINSSLGFMHRIIVNLTSDDKNLFVDHINHNILDNRKENLRIVTKTQNDYNRKPLENNQTGYKGVIKYSFISKRTGKEVVKYKVKIVKNGKKYTGGMVYEIPEEAAIRYNEMAKILFGEYAYLNEVDMSKIPRKSDLNIYLKEYMRSMK